MKHSMNLVQIMVDSCSFNQFHMRLSWSIPSDERTNIPNAVIFSKKNENPRMNNSVFLKYNESESFFSR